MSWDIDRVKQELRGPVALAVPPFNEDLSLNLDAFREHIRFMIAGGLRMGQGVLICPSGTGEYLSLSPEEHRLMVQTAVEAVDGRFPVVAGVAGIDINHVIELARNARRAGARYAMIPAPFYDSIDQDGLYEWYRILSEKLDLGIMIYDQSWRSDLGTSLGLPLMERLTGLKNVVSLKYGSPSHLEAMIVALERFSDRFAFIDNSLGYTAAVGHMHGGTGFISGPAAWWPEFELHFFKLLEEGKYQEADRWHARLAPYMAWFHGEFWKASRFFHGSAVLKATLEYVGLYGGPLRPPFRAMNAQEKRELHAVMEQIGVKKPAYATR